MSTRAWAVTAGLVLVGWLVWERSGHALAWQDVRPVPAVAAVGVAVVGNALLCGWRWAVVGRLPVGRATRWYLEATFFSVLVPSGVGGDVYRIGRDTGGGRAHAATAVAADRAVGGLATLALAVPCAFLVLPGRDAVWLAAGAAAALPALVLVRRRLGARFAAVREIGRGQVLAASGITAGYLLVFAGVLALSALAVGLHPGAADVVLWAPLVALAGMLPSVHGLGAAQGAVALFLVAAGGSGSAAGVGATLSFLTMLATAGAGGLALALRGRQAVAA